MPDTVAVLQIIPSNNKDQEKRSSSLIETLFFTYSMTVIMYRINISTKKGKHFYTFISLAALIKSKNL